MTTAPFTRNEEATADLLTLVGVDVTPQTVAGWEDWQVQKAEDWAGAVHLKASDNAVPVPPMPAFLREFDVARISS